MAKDAQKKQWTLMVYLAGDNSLDAAGVADLSEMKSTGSTDAINVVAQYDRSGVNTSTKRYYLRKGTTLVKDMVQSLGETNTGDPKVLADFVAWSIKNYPAEHYLLVLWNHGAGWDDSNIYTGDVFSGAAPPVVRGGQVVSPGKQGAKSVPLAQARAGVRRVHRALFSTTVQKAVNSRAIAFDDQAQDFLDNVEMKRVLTKVKSGLKRKIDILGFDACLMSMVEVAYQMKGAVNYCVGSEETEPNDGWPYNRILKTLAAKPTMSPEELSATVVKNYLASYGKNDGVTQAATNLARVDAVAKAIDGLAKALRGALGDDTVRTAITDARNQVQEYSPPYDDYCDLTDLGSLIAKHAARPAITDACAAVEKAVTDAVVESGAKGQGVANSHGISIYFPKRKISPLYKTLDFVKKNAWASFLADYLQRATRRP